MNDASLPLDAPDRASYHEAMDAAGALLARRARTASELRHRLVRNGFDSRRVEQVVERLCELGLVDDAAYARAWIEQRTRKGRSARLCIHELEQKGVAPEVAEQAAADVGGDELRRASDVALAILAKAGDLPLERQAARIAGALARRGFEEEVVYEAVAAVLPPPGWD